jgi:hypothetical protein
MANPIIEDVMNAIVTAINAVTVAAGYNQDLHAGRMKQVDINNMLGWYLNGGCPYGTGQVLAGQLDNNESPDGASNTGTRNQRVFLTCFVSLSDSSDESPETPMNKIGADIIKKLLENKTQILGTSGEQLGRILLDDNPFAMSIINGKGFCTLNMEFTAQYVTEWTNPYILK